MNGKIISGVSVGIAIIAVILVAQNAQVGIEDSNETKTSITNAKINSECVLEFKEAFPNENENVIKNLCDNSEFRNELYPFSDIVNVNSYGFRGAEFSSNKPIDTYRIFLVGGSTMWGSGNYSDETTIPGILQKIFDKQESQTKIEVINAGMSGTNTISESKLIKERLVNFQPDLIIMYDGWNDLRAEYSPEMIYNNWKSVCEIGNQNEFDIIITLQPIAGFGNKELTHQEYVNALTGNNHNNMQLLLQKNQYEEYANKLQDLLTTCTLTKDLRNVFDDVSGPIFWDQGHASDAGNMIVAEKIYEISLPIVQENLSPHTLFNEILKKYNNPTVISYLLDQYGVDTSNFEEYGKTNAEDGRYFELKEKVGVENILVGKDLSNVNLSTINLVDRDLTGANLSGQNLTNIDLTGTILINVDFTNANLSGLDLTYRNLSGSIFHETDLSETTWINTKCTFCKISNTNFSDLIFAEVQFRHATIVNSDLSNMRLLSTSFADANISNVDFSNSDLSFDPQYVPHQIEIELDKFGMESDEIYNLDRKQFEDKVNQIYYPRGGFIPTFLLTNFTLQDEMVYVNFLVINSFVGANLSTVNFSNSNLTAVEFVGSTVSGLNLLNADLSCINQDFCSGEIFLTYEE